MILFITMQFRIMAIMLNFRKNLSAIEQNVYAK
jgi:hypothetical protein